jgi:hypothetical protein
MYTTVKPMFLAVSTKYSRAVAMNEPNDLIDQIIDALRESSPGSSCFSEDDIRACLGTMLNGEGE